MAGLTADGFEAKTFEDIVAAFVTAERATIDVNIDTSQFALVGQLNGIMASEVAQLWELAEELHDASDPDKAVGASQDALYSLTNTLRRGASKSSVLATVTLQPGTSIAIGDAQASVAGNPLAKFVNAEPMVGSGTVYVRFEALELGPVVANAGTLTVRDTLPTGWDSITNALDADVGSVVEGNAGYRLRRVQELASQGGGTCAGIRADLLQLTTVRAVLVLENTTAATVDGMPPKSFEAVVSSYDATDDDAAIAQSIWSNKPAGMQAFGTEAVVITDSEGESHTVRFSRPTPVPVYVSLRLLTDPLVYTGDAAAKTALVTSAEDPTAPGYLDVGVDVYAGQLVAAAMALPGVINADARLGTAVIADFDAASGHVAISAREIAVLDSSRITIGAFP